MLVRGGAAELPQIGRVGTKLHHEIRVQLFGIAQISTKTPPAFRWEIDFRELNILTSVSMSTIRDRKVQTETLIFSQISQYGFSFPFLVTIRMGGLSLLSKALDVVR